MQPVHVRTMYPNQTRCCLYVLVPVPVPVPVLCALGSVCPSFACVRLVSCHINTFVLPDLALPSPPSP